MLSLKKILGNDPSAKLLKEAEKIVGKVNAFEAACMELDDAALKAKTDEFRLRLAQGEPLDALLPEAFAVAREAARRSVKLRHYDVQLIGGWILHNRAIAEMKTGEGKTLVATLAAYLNALLKRGVHVVTVNDYLARRDAVWMGQVYDALGLTVGVINGDGSYIYDGAHKEEDAARDEEGSFRVFHDFLRPVSRKEAYAADITYGTNSEFGFDYLRDHVAYRAEDLRMRESGYAYAIVDEIDSILIDEARTPLIISAPAAESDDFYRTFARIATTMVPEEDYTVDEKHRAVRLTDAGISKAERALGIDNIYTDRGIKEVHHLETAVRAKALFRKDKEYVVRDGSIVIVDEFTGRMQPGRRWSEGLHQAIEAKEGVAIERESRTFASVTYQNFFRLYDKLSGMTGTAATSREEFYKVYGLEVVEIPTNRPVARRDRGDLIFQTETGKFKAIARRVKEMHAAGMPVLIGTVSIEKNELLSSYLRSEGVPHEVLNAKNHEREGEIIAQAGHKGQVTVATNMAGRGVDIKLGGATATKEEAEEVKRLGGLAVIGTERHEARRIDNQLRGRSGRQGDPGETQFFVSLEDSLMRVFASDTVKSMMGRFGIPEDEPIENRLVTRALESAQGKIEGFNFDARKHVLEYDDVLDKQRKSVYAKRRAALVGSLDEVEAVLRELGEGDAQAPALLEKKMQDIGRKPLLSIMRELMLRNLDLLWVEHLESMEYLRGSVNLRAYGQRDPLLEYRREGLNLFRDMEARFSERIFELLNSITKEALSQAQAPAAAPAPLIAQERAHAAQEIGRNDPCPCGSGKKWKHCGLKNTEEHQRLSATI